ncbi:hypothetical protein Tco_1029206 [Tanacetum coccineum]|uniref:Uncharacterized protein n=1 Tax=Tanacetum coccineum TaxID=301880 RepID=A0ABQ5G2T0_9ASTR
MWKPNSRQIVNKRTGSSPPILATLMRRSSGSRLSVVLADHKLQAIPGMIRFKQTPCSNSQEIIVEASPLGNVNLG